MERETSSKLKKRIIAGGLYIALAVTVVGVTIRSINTILSDEIYDIGNRDAQYDYSSDIVLPDNLTDILKDSEKVSDIPEGIDAEIKNDADNTNEATPNEENDVSEGAAVYENLYIKPVSGYISVEFSDSALVYSPSMYDYRVHSAIDIAADISTPVKAFSDGVISSIYDHPLYGVTVEIKHSGNLISKYSNLSGVFPDGIEEGAFVKVGEVIGAVGESAACESAEAPHLHFEVIKDGKKVNPEDFYELAE